MNDAWPSGGVDGMGEAQDQARVRSGSTRTGKGGVREVEWGDLERIWRFAHAHLAAFHGCSYGDFESVWAHRWRSNPAAVGNQHLGWVIEDFEGAVAGFSGLVPLPLKVGDITRTALCGANWFIRPDVRRLSLTAFRGYAGLAKHQIMLSTGLSAAAARVHASVGGMEPVPVQGLERCLWWIIDGGALLDWKARALAERSRFWRLAAASRAASVVGPVWPAALGIATDPRHRPLPWLRSSRIAFPCRELDVEPVHAFGEEFDRFWSEHRRRFDVTVERTAEFLAWRHARLPSFAGRCFVLACRERGRLLGYVSVQQQGYANRMPDCYVVTDLIYPPERLEVLHNLMNAAFRLVVDRKGAVLKLTGFHPMVLAAMASQRPLILEPSLLHRLATSSLTGTLAAALGLAERQGGGDRRAALIPRNWWKAPAETAATLRAGSWWPTGIDGTTNL